ncbi:hypothetical protein HDE_09037 [Halotydeus destructor]|nr:hypothetical protein HDE_09037 [Halotydeus destructor]
MVCLTAHSVGAMDVDLVAHVFSLIGVLLDLLTILGGQGSPGGATSSGRAGCNTPTETTDICGYYRNNAACPSLVGCNICTQGGGQDRINKECAAACTLFKNDRYQNGKRTTGRIRKSGQWPSVGACSLLPFLAQETAAV